MSKGKRKKSKNHLKMNVGSMNLVSLINSHHNKHVHLNLMG
jgi:hypothetical protein